MARVTSAKCRICRREGEKLFLKGERCYSPKCALIRRNYPPGMHGQNTRGRKSEYSLQLREKQKLKRTYGLMERQFANYFAQAAKKREDTGKGLARLLELRLDNIVYRLGFARSRSTARQLVLHRHIMVNGKVVNIPSCQVKKGDMIQIKESGKEKAYFAALTKAISLAEVPKWLSCDKTKLVGTVVEVPGQEDMGQLVNMRLVIEYYSK